MNEEKTLAQKCYESEHAEETLYSEIVKIMEPQQVYNIWTDGYDGSVEVIMFHGSEGMSRKQADEILAFGFNGIYETCDGVGRSWSKKGVSACIPRGDEQEEDQVIKLKIQRGQLREALQGLVDWQNGPPLDSQKWKDGWGKAMDNALRILDKP